MSKFNKKSKNIVLITILCLIIVVPISLAIIYNNKETTDEESSNINYGQLFNHEEINLKANYVTPTYNDSSDISGIDIVLFPKDENENISTLEQLSIGYGEEVTHIFNMSASDDLYSDYEDGLGYIHIEDTDKWRGYYPERTKKYQCKIFGPNDKEVYCNITFNPEEYKDCKEALQDEESEEDSNLEESEDNETSYNEDSSSLEDVIENTFDPGSNSLDLLSYQKEFSAGSQFSILFPGTLSEGSSLIIDDDQLVGYSFCIPIVESFDDSEIENIIVDDTYSFDHDDEDEDDCIFTVTGGKIQLLTYDSDVAMHFADDFKIEINDIYGNTSSDYITGLGSDITDMIDNFDVASQYQNKNLYDYVD